MKKKLDLKRVIIDQNYNLELNTSLPNLQINKKNIKVLKNIF